MPKPASEAESRRPRALILGVGALVFVVALGAFFARGVRGRGIEGDFVIVEAYEGPLGGEVTFGRDKTSGKLAPDTTLVSYDYHSQPGVVEIRYRVGSMDGASYYLYRWTEAGDLLLSSPVEGPGGKHALLYRLRPRS